MFASSREDRKDTNMIGDTGKTELKLPKPSVAKDVLPERQGYATCQGKRYVLVSRTALRNSRTGERVINAVDEAAEDNVGYLPMTLLHVGKTWKRGGEADWGEPNGEYDWIMGEQKGWLTPHMTYGGGRCHDE